MKVKLKPGEELDLLTADELRKVLEGLARQRNTRLLRTAENGKTDAAGGLKLSVYNVPIGYELTVSRIEIDADSATPGAPFTAAAGFVDVLRNDKRTDFVKLAAGDPQGGLPAIRTWARDQGPTLRNGEELGILVVGGPAATGIEVTLQGRLTGPPAE